MICPGFAFAALTSSLKLPMPDAVLTTTAIEASLSIVIAVKSRS